MLGLKVSKGIGLIPVLQVGDFHVQLWGAKRSQEGDV